MLHQRSPSGLSPSTRDGMKQKAMQCKTLSYLSTTGPEHVAARGGERNGRHLYA